MKSRINWATVSFLLATPLAFDNFGISPENQVVLKACVWAGVAIIVGLHVVQRRLVVRCSIKNPTYSFVLVVFASAAFSVSGYGMLAAMVLLVFALHCDSINSRSSDEYKQSLYYSAFVATTALTAINAISSLAPQAYVISDGYQRLQGVVGQPSQASQVAAIAVLLGLYYASNWRTKAFALVVSGYVIYEAGGRTILLALAMAIIAPRLLQLKVLKAAAACLVMLGVVFPFIAIALADVLKSAAPDLLNFARSGDLREIYTLSGRIPLWNAVIAGVEKNGIFGVGYSNSRALLPTVYSSDWGWSTDSAHNAYLHLLYETGLFGLLLMLWVLFSGIRLSTEKEDLGLFLFIALVSVMSSTFAGPGISVLCLLLIMFCLSGRRPRSSKQPGLA